MKWTSLFIFLIPILGWTQILQYSPNRKLEKTVSKTYYDTEFIFLKNSSDASVSLNFKVLDNTLISDWSATICTNTHCFNQIPKSGGLGTIEPGKEAYISFNFAANEAIGEGQIRFLITSSSHQELSDTVTFRYTVTDDGSIKAGPWANVNFAQGVLTVLLENPHLETDMYVFNVEGKEIFNDRLGHITSLPLRDYPKGLYLVVIRDENNRVIREKIVHY